MFPLHTAKVLITGGSGFLGSHLSRHLATQCGEVHAVSRIHRTDPAGIIRWWQVNLEHLEAVRTLVSTIKPDVIFHLSGLVSGGQTADLVLPTFHTLLTSTINLLTIATEVGCARIILAGSLNELKPELGETIPSSPYAAAKWAGSTYGRMFHALYKTPVVIVRPYMTYGPGQDVRKLIPYVTLSLLQGKSPEVSSGPWEVDWIYVDDVTEGFVAAALVPNIEGETFDLGSGDLWSVRHVVDELVRKVGSPIQPFFGRQSDRKSEPPMRKADVTKTWERLGWSPMVPLETGLQRTVEWYRAQFLSS